jgi:hypothetical protein
MLGHFLGPFPIFQNVSFETLSKQPKWPDSEPAGPILRGHILLSMHSKFILPICLQFRIDVKNYSIVRGATVPSSNLSRKNLHSQSVTNIFYVHLTVRRESKVKEGANKLPQI